jgi:hypothetical protein
MSVSIVELIVEVKTGLATHNPAKPARLRIKPITPAIITNIPRILRKMLIFPPIVG